MAKIPSYPALPLAELDPTTALYVVDGGRSRRLLSGTFLDWINAGLPAVGQGAFVRLDINGRLPALDGRRLTNLPSTGSGGGAVSSVNGQTGAVALTASDVGAAATGHTHDFSSLTSIPAPLSAIGALTAAADRFPYFTSSSAAALATLTTFGRSLLDDADAAAARTTLGLGSAATYDAANLPISTAVQVALDGKADGAPAAVPIADMLADLTVSRPVGTVLQARTSTGAVFPYIVAASGATDHNLTTAGGVKLYAVPVAGLYMTPEQLGYTDAAQNWGACAQIAWNAGYVLRLGPREYLTSSTAYIRSRTGVIGEGDRVSGVKAAAGFGGNIIDTENFAARVTLGSVRNDDEVTNGALYGTVLRDFYIDGNRLNVPDGTATSGIGLRLYGRMPAITNLRITYCAAHGMQTALAAGTADPFSSLNHSRIGFVDGLWVMDCGREGWIFQGPADIPAGRVFIGNNGRAGSGVYDALSPTRSLVFPGETCDGLVLDNVGAEFANGHVWNHLHGRGIRIRTDVSGVRARFFNMISEGNWGQVHISSGARVEFYGEIHGNDGGPRNERVFYDATNNAGTAWAVGQTLTGATSGAVGTITAIDARTSSTGMITVSFASDAAREIRFRDNETVTNGLGRTAVVHRPDFIGAVPWWRDESMQGNLVSLKVFQTGLNDGGPMLRIQGQNHVYTVQCQSSTPRFGHGIVLVGNNVTINGYIEGRARYAADGATLSAGLFVDAAAQRANVDLTIKSCQQNVVFAGASIGSRFSITSVDPLGDHMNGITPPSVVLDAATIARSRLVAIDAGAVAWERGGAALATVADVRGGTGTGVSSPPVEAAARVLVDRGALSGDIILDPSLGPVQAVRITGNARILPPTTLLPFPGTLRVRMEGAYALTWDPRILRGEDDPDLSPDPRSWLDTVYCWDVVDGRLRVWQQDAVPAVTPAPGTGTFRGLYDPGAGLFGDTGAPRVDTSTSALSTLGDPVKYLPPVAGSWSYVDPADGVTKTLPTADRAYVTAETTNLPVLAVRGGRYGVQFAGAGLGLRARLSGLQSIGSLAATPTAMAPRTRLSWGGMVYLPAGVTAGAIAAVFREENSNTAQLGLFTGTDGLINARGRFAGSSVPQLSTAADVAANSAVYAAEIAGDLGRWMSIVWQLRVTSVDTTADSDPPSTTTRGQGMTYDLWIDDGVDAMHFQRTISSYQGANGLGRRMNRSALGVWGSGGAISQPAPVLIGRHWIMTDDVAPGSADWLALTRWLGGA